MATATLKILLVVLLKKNTAERQIHFKQIGRVIWLQCQLKIQIHKSTNTLILIYVVTVAGVSRGSWPTGLPYSLERITETQACIVVISIATSPIFSTIAGFLYLNLQFVCLDRYQRVGWLTTIMQTKILPWECVAKDIICLAEVPSKRQIKCRATATHTLRTRMSTRMHPPPRITTMTPRGR